MSWLWPCRPSAETGPNQPRPTLSRRCSIATPKRPPAEPASILAFARLVIDALEAARVQYLLGGPLAAALSGEPRSTLGVDFVVSLKLDRIEAPSKVDAAIPECGG